MGPIYYESASKNIHMSTFTGLLEDFLVSPLMGDLTLVRLG